jgi:hypothetical protein
VVFVLFYEQHVFFVVLNTIVILSVAYAESKDPTNGVLTLPMGSFDFGFAYAQDDKKGSR